VSKREPSPITILRLYSCVRCSFLAQLFDVLVITRDGLAHRQCAKGGN
jgi:hypothetical protein